MGAVVVACSSWHPSLVLSPSHSILMLFTSMNTPDSISSPVSRIPVVEDDNANAWGAAMYEAGLSFCFDDDPSEVVSTGTGERLFTDAEAAEVAAILEAFSAEDYADAMSGCMDAMHEDNAYMSQKTGEDLGESDGLHGVRAAAPVGSVDAGSYEPVGVTLERLGFVHEDSGGGHEFYKRDNGNGLAVLVTDYDGSGLPCSDEPIRLALVRSSDLLEIGSFVVDGADLVSKLSAI